MAMTMIRRVMPPAFMNSPASMKNGTANSGKLFAPSHMFWMTIWGSVMPIWNMTARPQPTSANATGMPRGHQPQQCRDKDE
jgi:hypothetical protein